MSSANMGPKTSRVIVQLKLEELGARKLKVKLASWRTENMEPHEVSPKGQT